MDRGKVEEIVDRKMSSAKHKMKIKMIKKTISPCGLLPIDINKGHQHIRITKCCNARVKLCI
jgi:hypothetical protein